jgi:hypothetical protein
VLLLLGFGSRLRRETATYNKFYVARMKDGLSDSKSNGMRSMVLDNVPAMHSETAPKTDNIFDF